MRAILQNELNAVLRRRGFRDRPWAVEWDDAAVEFLLEQGFTGELGARPLKRAFVWPQSTDAGEAMPSSPTS
jgi:ATP-dependent Clp protease ATP-binding subunit ClpC